MLSRRNWMMDFIGRALRKGLSDDPDWTFDSTSEMYSDWDDLEPGFAADSALSAKVLRPTDTPTSEVPYGVLRGRSRCDGLHRIVGCGGHGSESGAARVYLSPVPATGAVLLCAVVAITDGETLTARCQWRRRSRSGWPRSTLPIRASRLLGAACRASATASKPRFTRRPRPLRPDCGSHLLRWRPCQCGNGARRGDLGLYQVLDRPENH